jgi:hypothetical protein
MKLSEIAKLPSADPATLQEWNKVSGWLSEERSYHKTPVPENFFDARLTRQQLREIIFKKKAEPLPRGCIARSGCKVFTVLESAKRRKRLIEHPWEVNDAIADEVDRVSFITMNERHQAVHKGQQVIQLDFSAWFDQFELSPAVRDYFCFKAGRDFLRMRVLPMGMRASVAVAQAATRQLLNFDHRGCYVEV